MKLPYGATLCGDCSATYCLLHKVSILFRMPFSKLRRVCAVIGSYVAQLLTAPTNRIHAKTLTLLIIASCIDNLFPVPLFTFLSLCIPIERTAKGESIWESVEHNQQQQQLGVEGTWHMSNQSISIH